MRTSGSYRPALLLLLAMYCAWALALDAPGWASEQSGRPLQFNRDIRPLLSDKCFPCHGPDAEHREADLRLDVAGEALADRDGAPALVAGAPEKSEVWRRVTDPDEDVRMPPPDTGKTLSSEDLALLRAWIQQGAKYEEHWSYRPLRRPTMPATANDQWARNVIDRLLFAGLKQHGLAPAEPADKITLARRAYFDLIGLPPTPEQVDAFCRDDRPEAFERLVDSLLESPHFGERMAVYWLDLVRYADTVGYHGDQEHHISPYRDYVINAFNDNMPFDQFTTEQLAGDLLPDATTAQKIASGYNRLLQTTHEGGAQDKEYLAKYAADRVRNVSAVWMGATMGCCECHDHKFDPYTQRDFYSMAAFFADLQEQGAYKGAGNTSPTSRPPEIDVLSPIDEKQLAAIDQRIADLQQSIGVLADDDERRAELASQLKQLLAQRAAQARDKRRTMVSVAVQPRVIRVLARGDWMDDTGPIVEPAVPAFLPNMEIHGRRATRLDLARWLTGPLRAQTARVFMNRLWYLFFGQGISRNLLDTGSQGELPTHPQLLDYLAGEFIDSGWNMKKMVRSLVTTRAYQQSSAASPSARQKDPENLWFSHQSRFRLPAEMIRDNALAISGLLVDRIGGPSARPYQPAHYYEHLNFPKRKYKADVDDNQYRRGVYVHWQRQFLHPMLKAFDAPSREECTAQRPRSNTPLAALTLLNDPTFVEAARVFGAHVLASGGETDEQRIAWAWWRVTSRRPAPQESVVLQNLLDRSRQRYEAHPAEANKLLNVGLAAHPEGIDVCELAAWTNVTRTLLNLSEVITRR